MLDKTLLWEEPIHEIKVVVGKDSFSYKRNQVLTFFPNGPGSASVKRIISDITRERIDEEVVYQIITTDMDGEDHATTKAFIGVPVYISFKF